MQQLGAKQSVCQEKKETEKTGLGFCFTHNRLYALMALLCARLKPN